MVVNLLVPVFILPLCILGSFLICLFADQLGRALSLMDDPRSKAHGTHARPTPLVGGIAVVLPWTVAVIAFHGLGLYGAREPFVPLLTIHAVLFILAFLVIGVLDDRYSLSVKSRLISKTALYIFLVAMSEEFTLREVVIPSLAIDWDWDIVSLPITVLCFVALNNAVNMADGRNGLVIGMAFIWLVSLILHLGALADPPLLILPALLVVVGVFNLCGRLFLGDAGSYALSTLAGMLAIWAHTLPLEVGGLTTTQLGTLFAIPALDMLRVIAARAMRGTSITAPGQDHLHHRMDRVWGWGVGLPLYLSAVAIPIAIALWHPYAGVGGLLAACMLYGALWHATRDGTSAELRVSELGTD